MVLEGQIKIITDDYEIYVYSLRTPWDWSLHAYHNVFVCILRPFSGTNNLHNVKCSLIWWIF